MSKTVSETEARILASKQPRAVLVLDTSAYGPLVELDVPREIVIGQHVVALGRSNHRCDVVLRSRNRPRLISRVHARVMPREIVATVPSAENAKDTDCSCPVHQWVICDENSMNGTFVNDTRIGPAWSPLLDGDKVCFGGSVVLRRSIQSNQVDCTTPRNTRVRREPSNQATSTEHTVSNGSESTFTTTQASMQQLGSLPIQYRFYRMDTWIKLRASKTLSGVSTFVQSAVGARSHDSRDSIALGNNGVQPGVGNGAASGVRTQSSNEVQPGVGSMTPPDFNSSSDRGEKRVRDVQSDASELNTTVNAKRVALDTSACSGLEPDQGNPQVQLGQPVLHAHASNPRTTLASEQHNEARTAILPSTTTRPSATATPSTTARPPPRTHTAAAAGTQSDAHTNGTTASKNATSMGSRIAGGLPTTGTERSASPAGVLLAPQHPAGNEQPRIGSLLMPLQIDSDRRSGQAPSDPAEAIGSAVGGTQASAQEACEGSGSENGESSLDRLARARGEESENESIAYSDSGAADPCRCGAPAGCPACSAGEDAAALGSRTVPGVLGLLAGECTCPVCHDVFVSASTLGCGHSFCRRCIDMWLRERQSCPVCRVAVYIPPVPSCALDSAAHLAVTSSRALHASWVERKAEAAATSAEAARLTAELEARLAEAQAQGYRFLQIGKPWNRREKRRFRKGVQCHAGNARAVFCKSVGLTLDYIAKASLSALQMAAFNLSIRNLESVYDKETSTVDIGRLRSRLALFLRYG